VRYLLYSRRSAVPSLSEVGSPRCGSGPLVPLPHMHVYLNISLVASKSPSSFPSYIICIDFNSSSMKTYYCNCERYCQGDRKEVSRSTFFRHEKHRAIFTPRFQEYLTRHPIVVPEPGPSGRLTNTGPFPQYNCTAQVEGFVGRDAVEVSIISHWYSRSY